MDHAFLEEKAQEEYMANTQIDICNKALDLLGQAADIGNIEHPTTENEQICARWYWDTLDYVLRRYVWNFAIARKILPRDEQATPPFDYSDAYKLPSDNLRILAINGREDLGELDYDLAGGYLLLNNNGADSLKLKYIKRVKDVTLFDSGFCQLVSLFMALNMAFRFTQKQTTLERLYRLIELEEAKIVSIDGQEHPPKRIQHSKYCRVRRGGSVYGFNQFRPVAKDGGDS